MWNFAKVWFPTNPPTFCVTLSFPRIPWLMSQLLGNKKGLHIEPLCAPDVILTSHKAIPTTWPQYILYKNKIFDTTEFISNFTLESATLEPSKCFELIFQVVRIRNLKRIFWENKLCKHMFPGWFTIVERQSQWFFSSFHRHGLFVLKELPSRRWIFFETEVKNWEWWIWISSIDNPSQTQGHHWKLGFYLCR